MRNRYRRHLYQCRRGHSKTRGPRDNEPPVAHGTDFRYDPLHFHIADLQYRPSLYSLLATFYPLPRRCCQLLATDRLEQLFAVSTASQYTNLTFTTTLDFFTRDLTTC